MNEIKEKIEHTNTSSGKVFKVSDRVKVYYREIGEDTGRWYAGTIESFEPKISKWSEEAVRDLLGNNLTTAREIYEKIEEKDDHYLFHLGELNVIIRTDDKVSDNPDDLFEGYGLWYDADTDQMIHEYEEEFEVESPTDTDDGTIDAIIDDLPF